MLGYTNVGCNTNTSGYTELVYKTWVMLVDPLAGEDNVDCLRNM